MRLILIFHEPKSPTKRSAWTPPHPQTRKSKSFRTPTTGQPSLRLKRRCFRSRSSLGSSRKLSISAAPQFWGLQAKPIIDIMVPVQDLESSIHAIEAAQAVGYCYHPYKPEQMHWFCKPSPALRTHHLHLVPWQSRLWQERIAFRDALRMSPSRAQEYGNLKMNLAAQHRLDREAYTEGKSTFVATVLKSCVAVAPRPPLPLA